MTDADNNFLSRWARRKAQVQARREGVVELDAAEPQADVPKGQEKAQQNSALLDADQHQGAAARAPVQAAAAPAPIDLTAPTTGVVEPSPVGKVVNGSAPAAAPPSLPTMDDLARLAPDGDFSPFVGRAVEPELRNAAMKKLFTNPHFNVMDGLDVYIDDYNKEDPLPRQWMRQLVQARVLGLLDDDAPDQPLPPGDAVADDVAHDVQHAAAADEVAVAHPPDQAGEPEADPPPTHNPDAHEDADLSLQPHDALERARAETRADDPSA